jgi:two-component system, response regulator PdtaR
MNVTCVGPSREQGQPRAAVILVVEDEVLVRLWVADELRDRGFTVLEAANADEARDILKTVLSVELVLTDRSMPGAMNGSGLVTWVKAQRPEVKTILASSQRGVDAVDAFLEKPFTAETLNHLIHVLLVDGT